MIHANAPVRWMAVLLAIVAGFVDATGFVMSQGFFVSFMSGNSTRLAVSLSDSAIPTMIALVIILAFVAGVTGATMLNRVAGSRCRAPVMALVAAALALAAASPALAPATVTLALTAFAMGATNIVLQDGGEVRIGVTYMTGALVRVGQGIAAQLTGSGGWEWLHWLLLWAGLVAGAVAGGFAALAAGVDALWLPAAVSAVLVPVLANRPVG